MQKVQQFGETNGGINVSKRVLQQAIAAIMGASAIGGCYSSGGHSNNSDDNYGDICRSEGAKLFRKKKKRRKTAKASRQKNRRG